MSVHKVTAKDVGREGQVYDVIGIGFGPANIALAIAMEEMEFAGTRLFLERHASTQWQPEMMLSGSDIQNHPSRDLVTPRNPRSRYTFTNFLFENDRLFEHLNLGLEFPLRSEFAEYVRWVAGFFARDVAYNQSVSQIQVDPASKLYTITTQAGVQYQARSVVLAPGRTPVIPQVFANAAADRVFHLTQYLGRLASLAQKGELKRVAVVGGSQSAIEIILHLRHTYPNLEIVSVQRGYGFRLKDTSQFSEHVYFPSFVDQYYNSSAEAKKNINRHLHYTNYSAADADVIKELYVGMYEDKLQGRERVIIKGLSEIQGCTPDGEGYSLSLRNSSTHATEELGGLDAIVLATGFRNLGTGPQEERYPAILKDLAEHLESDAQGVIRIGRDYSLAAAKGSHLPALYLNGLCESSHGYGDAGSFSLLSLRSRDIFNSLNQQLGLARAAEKIA
ncbi:SidA/IucD/PvdA family monooxygenase [Pseudomonas protegens]|uniref:SidA/IucD/PvdA family monooxygenase n=1 Tax=Pseudomonas protegens TaxID=380021 RepID=UPI001E5FE7B8|nr:SidA/IucD/PvdA family monooxygenase [Pseudomonas protegens]MCD9567969.1 SidA/IucD/PvdA family monooxygenase [Pseudomonas protegens]